MNGDVQTVPRAELEAIAQVLENAVKPLCIYTDHLNHVNAIERGKGYCCDPMGKNVDIWRRVWRAAEKLGGWDENLQVKWIRSHQTKKAGETR